MASGPILSSSGAAAAALLFAFAAEAAPQPTGRPIDYKGHFATFPSGMRLVVYERPGAAEAMFSASYRVGASDEPKGKEGIAHLAEHLAFRAAPGAPGSPRLWDRLLSAGVRFNAFTSWDSTVFWERSKPEQLDVLLAVEADRMRDPLAGVTPQEFLAEREVVVNELRQRLDYDPIGTQLAWLLEASFPGHPYGRTIGGTVESVRGIALEDVRAWYREHYSPAHTVLVLWSPRPVLEAARAVLERFGTLAVPEGAARIPPVGRVPPPLPSDPPEGAPLPVRHATVTGPHLWVGWAVPGEYSRSTPQAFATQQALDGILRGRMREPDAIDVVLDQRSFVLSLDGLSVIAARIDLRREEDAPRVLEMVKDQLIHLTLSDLGPLASQELVGAGPSTAHALPLHYDALKGRGKARYLTLATVASRNRLLVENYLDIERLYAPDIAQYLRATGIPDYIGGFQRDVAATLSTVIDTFAGKFVTRKRTLAMLVVPDRNVAPSSVAPPAPAREVARDVDSIDDGQARLSKAAGPAESIARAPGLDRAERRRLPNGLEVVVAKRGTLPIVEVRLVVRTDPEGGARVAPGLPVLALRSSSTALSNIHWGKSWMVGSSTGLWLDSDRLRLDLRAASGNLPDLLSDVSLWVDSLSTDGKAFEHRRDAWAAQLEAAREHPIPRAGALFVKKLYPDRPYGRVPTPEGVRAIELAEVKRWIDEEIRPERATLLVVGDVEPLDETWKRIESELGGWKRGGGPPAPEPARPPAQAGRSIVLVDRPGASQAAILVGLRLAEGAGRDEAALAAFRWQLDFELRRRIRVQEGVSYGVYVQPLRRVLAEALLVTAAVDQAAAAHSLQRILGTIQALAAEPPSAAAAERARWQVARDYAFQFDTVGDVQDRLEESAFLGLPADHWERQAAAIASLTPERLQAAARSLGPGREVVVIVGDRKALGPQLQAAGYQVEAPPAP